MRFDTGTIIAISAALLFYLRMIILQRQRAKTSSQKNAKKPKYPAQPQSMVVIRNRYLVGLGVLLVAIGAVLSAAPSFDSSIQAWWWVPVTAGILLMSLGIG